MTWPSARHFKVTVTCERVTITSLKWRADGQSHNCFKTYMYCDNTRKNRTFRWTHFSSIGWILVSITAILMSIVSILASIEQVNTLLVEVNFNYFNISKFHYIYLRPLECDFFLFSDNWCSTFLINLFIFRVLSSMEWQMLNSKIFRTNKFSFIWLFSLILTNRLMHKCASGWHQQKVECDWKAESS